MKKITIKELREFCKTHSKTEVLNKYGSNGVHVMYKYNMEHPKKYRTLEVKTKMIQEDYKNGMRQCELVRKYGLTRQRISKIVNK